jgi:peroxiredoxin (alkyl hydroperoxide reductase subunit C)
MRDEQERNILLLGDAFPSIEVMTTLGPKSIPADYKDKWLVLFSHPADFTPVCTTEFVAFQRRYGMFKALNCELIGLSIDQVFSHLKWEEWIKDHLNVDIEFPIIADTGRIARILNLIHPSQGENTVRGVFIIDPAGLIRSISYYPHETGRNIDEIIRLLKAIQISDSTNVVTPANWPNNELIQDNVIIQPAGTKEAIAIRGDQQKNGEIGCYDWWFCYKKLS